MSVRVFDVTIHDYITGATRIEHLVTASSTDEAVESFAESLADVPFEYVAAIVLVP